MLSPTIQEARLVLATTKNDKAIKTGQLRQASIFTQILYHAATHPQNQPGGIRKKTEIKYKSEQPVSTAVQSTRNVVESTV